MTNREDIIRLARECGFAVGIGSPALPKFTALIEKVVAQEREACAVTCETLRFSMLGPTEAVKHQRDLCAAAIRARKDNT